MSGLPAPLDVRGTFVSAGLSNSAGKLVPIAAWFFLTPVMLREIGVDGYSLWVLLGSMSAYAYLLDLGIGGAVVKYVAEHSATGRTEETRALCATAVRLYVFLGALFLAASIGFAPAVATAFDDSGVDRRTIVGMVILIGMVVALTLASSPATSILQGKHRFDLYSLVTGGGSILMAALSALALFAGWGLLGLGGASLLATVVMRGAAFLMARHIAPELHLGWQGADWRLLRQVFVFSSSSFAMFVSSRLNTKSDEFVIAGFLPLAFVAPYALARKLGEVGQQISAQLVKTVMPLASELDARGEISRLRSLYLAGTRITLAAFIPVALPIALLAAPVLEAWVGAEYAGSASLVVILAVAGLVGTSQWTAQSIMEGLAEHRPIAIALLLGGLANIGLSILLVGPMGLMGVALGTLIPTIVVSFGVILPIVMRRLHLSCRQALVEVWLPALLPALPAGALIQVIGVSRFADGIPAMVIASAVGGAVYVALYLTFPGTATERGAVRGALRASARLVPGLRTR